MLAGDCRQCHRSHLRARQDSRRGGSHSRPDGHLYLSVNVHTQWGCLLHTGLAMLQIDRGHPYTFTSQSLRSLLATYRFDVLTERIEDYEQSRRADRDSANLRAQVKGYTGLSEFSHAAMPQ